MKIALKIGGLSMLICLITVSLNAQPDTLFANTSEKVPLIAWQHQYHQTLTMKLLLAQSHFDGEFKRRDNGLTTTYLTFEEALEVIKKIDRITLGIPKIMYLVGWQYNGHDSKYPAWFEVNKELKRDKDETAQESLIWLMNEAKKHHTTVSLHINMFDAYEDSPLWDVYVKNDIIARNEDGTLRAGEWGYPISYAQEFKTGLAQKRIDSLCQLLPIQKAGTVHIDAFHSWAPIGKDGPGKAPFIQGPISPYLGFSIEEEIEAQKKIFHYWASKGVDVTSEGATFLRRDKFAGIQAMAWWVDWSLQDYLDWQPAYYTGGVDRRLYGSLFGTSMHGEDRVKRDPNTLAGFKEDFCTKTLVWYYINRLKREFYVQGEDWAQVHFSHGVVSTWKDEKRTVSQGDFLLVDQNEIFTPALWLPEQPLVAYSRQGYTAKTWRLPENWENVKKVEIRQIGLAGKNAKKVQNVYDNKITLNLKPDQMLVITKR